MYEGGIQGLQGSTTIFASIKGTKVLGVVMKELDDKSFYIGNELRFSSMLEWMGCMLYNADSLKTLEGISSTAY